MSDERFSFVKEEDVEEMREGNEPGNTKRHTSWSTNCYAKWSEARDEHFRDIEPEDARFRTVPKLEDITVDEMNYWLSRFALEVRKRDGTNYRHEALYSLFCGINRVIKEKHPALSLFHSTELKPFQKTLDGRLKELQATQQPLQSTDALSVNDEMTMWAKGVLGTHSPDALLNTLLFLSGKLFVLRGGRELRSLTHDQIGFEERQDRSLCVTYKGNASKANQGGLKRRKVEPKVLQHIEDPLDERSFSFVYHFYVNKCPEDARVGAVFLRPKVKWKYGDEIWFEKSPVGHNLLQNRFKEMCKQAGLVGNFTNRSIRRTAVTRMYESGLMEKTIMIRSEHSSTDGVTAYQRENPGAQIKVPTVLSNWNC